MSWVVYAIIGALMLYGALAYTGEASAAELNPQQAAVIYAMAHSVSGLPLADKAPRIEIVSSEKLQQLMHGTPHVTYAGAYIYEDDTIYLDEALDFENPYDASILLHEAVHYLQVHARGAPTTCEQWAGNEIEAYGVQISVLEKAGLDARRSRSAASSYIGVCYRTNAKPGKAGASSDRLDKPATDKEWGCFWRQQVAAKVMAYKHGGGGMVDFWYANPLPVDWSDAMKEDAKQLIAEIFTSDDEAGVIRRRYNACLNAQ